jgi:hypothetical protein
MPAFSCSVPYALLLHLFATLDLYNYVELHVAELLEQYYNKKNFSHQVIIESSTQNQNRYITL